VPRVSTTRVALVTGASRGIGRAIAERLAPMAKLIVTARSKDTCDALVAAVNARDGDATVLELDAGDADSVARVIAHVRGLAPVDWLVNNAGMAASAPFLEHRRDSGPDLYAELMDVNFHAPRRLMEALVPDMIARRYGRVVNIASSAGLQPYAYAAAYVASKHALVGYSECAARELEKSGVTVNLVCPHFVDSPMTDASVARIVERTGRSSADARAALAAQNPGGALVCVDEVAAVVEELLTGTRNGAIAELVGAGAQAGEAVRWR
jgi:3-hydroxybutyrate dehydrogenase